MVGVIDSQNECLNEDREYMRKLLEYMKKNGRPPRTQRIDVNTKGEVIGGNHRTLATWLLRWAHIDATSVDAVAGSTFLWTKCTESLWRSCLGCSCRPECQTDFLSSGTPFDKPFVFPGCDSLGRSREGVLWINRSEANLFGWRFHHSLLHSADKSSGSNT